MSLRETVNQLLDDMDIIRPIVLAAMPDEPDLRATTRHMITALEEIKHAPAVPLNTYIWLCQLTSKLVDAEHGALLKPDANGLIPAAAQASIGSHVDKRQQLMQQALQAIPATHLLLDSSCELIGRKASDTLPLPARAQYLQNLLQQRLQQDACLRNELQQLIEAFRPSITAMTHVLAQVGEDAPELKSAQQILDQELPDDVEAARSVLQHARESILQAGSKLNQASKKLSSIMQEQMEKMSSLSSKLQQAESEARNDPLTGLANRRRLTEFLSTLGQAPFCFLLLDIDFFKKVNDTYGHDIGDEVLRQLAMRLKHNIRSTDLLARIGGEEFCVVLPAIDAERCALLAEKLRRTIESDPFNTQQGELPITISIGIAEHRAGRSQAETFKAADQALYISKQQGRNRVSSEEQNR